MVTNFQKETVDLGEEDLANEADIMFGMKAFLHSDIKVKSNNLIEMINMNLAHGTDYRLNDTKLRKWCNYFRSEGILPILATSSGYYISTDKAQIEMQIRSLKERANSILTAAKGLEIFLK